MSCQQSVNFFSNLANSSQISYRLDGQDFIKFGDVDHFIGKKRVDRQHYIEYKLDRPGGMDFQVQRFEFQFSSLFMFASICQVKNVNALM